jgi:hypothetical protein
VTAYVNFSLRGQQPDLPMTVRRAFILIWLTSFDGILPHVTMPSAKNPSGELLLVAIVEMASGHAAAGQLYEDAVLGLLDRHGGSIERRMRSTDSVTEVHLIRFRSRAGYESFMVDPDRLDYRDRLGDTAPSTRVLEVREL